MTSLISKGVDWFTGLSDFSHHAIVLGASASAASALARASPTFLAATTLTMVGTQLGMSVWVGSVAGPTMFLNMKKEDFGDIQSHLFPKFGMVGTSTSLVALVAYYHLARPVNIVTKVLAATLVSHVVQSFVFFPLSAKFMYERREFEEGTVEQAAASKKFGMTHGASMLTNTLTTGANIWVFYSFAKRIAHLL